MTRERIASLPPDDFRPRTASFKEPLLSRNLGVVEVLRGIGERHSRTPGEVAIAWTLRDPVVTGAIVRMRSAEQAKQIVRSAEFRVSPDEVLEIEDYLKANPVAAWVWKAGIEEASHKRFWGIRDSCRFFAGSTAQLSSAQATSTSPLTAVDKVDLRRYAGKWYGIARYPNRFRVTVNPTRLLSTGYEVTEKSKWSMRAVRRMGR
jgi:hypothetical protein